MAQKRILSLGRAAVRLDSVIGRFPMPNEEITSYSRCSIVLEGSGTACALASRFLGAESLLCSGVGDDLFGQKMIETFRDHGVETRFLFPFKGDRTTLAMHFREKGGALRRIFFEGAGEHLTTDEVEHAFLSFPDAAIASSELPRELVKTASLTAAEKKIPLFFLELDEVRPLEGGAFLYAVSSEKALRLTGDRTLSDAACMKACIRIAEFTPFSYCVIFLPNGGIFLYDGRYGKIHSGFSSEPIDEEGCDEAFLSALAVETAGGRTLAEALPFAFAARALTGAQPGYMESLPDRDEVELLLKNAKPME